MGKLAADRGPGARPRTESDCRPGDVVGYFQQSNELLTRRTHFLFKEVGLKHIKMLYFNSLANSDISNGHYLPSQTDD